LVVNLWCYWKWVKPLECGASWKVTEECLWSKYWDSTQTNSLVSCISTIMTCLGLKATRQGNHGLQLLKRLVKCNLSYKLNFSGILSQWQKAYTNGSWYRMAPPDTGRKGKDRLQSFISSLANVNPQNTTRQLKWHSHYLKIVSLRQLPILLPLIQNFKSTKLHFIHKLDEMLN
jgi:hypothetical protein